MPIKQAVNVKRESESSCNKENATGGSTSNNNNCKKLTTTIYLQIVD